MKMIRQAIVIVVSILFPGILLAGEPYKNIRFGYVIELPDQFSSLAEADNGDGGVATSLDKLSELRVFGVFILDGSFASEVEWRKTSDTTDGWSLSYTSTKKASASYSGTKSGTILYVRMLKGCQGSTSMFRLEYPTDQKQFYDPVVKSLVSSFRVNTKNC